MNSRLGGATPEPAHWACWGVYPATQLAVRKHRQRGYKYTRPARRSLRRPVYRPQAQTPSHSGAASASACHLPGCARLYDRHAGTLECATLLLRAAGGRNSHVCAVPDTKLRPTGDRAFCSSS
ncbi:hypothetical protein EYF80_009526 [Liparis tanakae]|uniref:Uncharacterized protein n=1 Tax=Liparis tanakae TaxID=230148 RepID=A0A4Z2IQU6_9TELE|nr:hypothetical protein EYF80_009526 [Liparis tanakae]